MRDRRLENMLHYVHTLAAGQRADELSDPELLRRFAADRDEAAFAALVRRHGPMVLGVCHRALGHTHDAEDAFQATLLILARQAASVYQPEALGGWLYRVARRVALKVRSPADRRSARDAAAAAKCQADPADELTWREALAVLDEELSRLPAAYRAALVLCYLEGKTQDEAARQLGWSLGALRGQLERGRHKLRARLLRRGVSSPAALLGVALAHGEASAAAVAVSTISNIVKAAKLFVTGQAAGVPPHVVALAERGVQLLFTAKLKHGAVWVLVVGILAAGAGLAAHHAGTANQGAAKNEELIALHSKSPKDPSAPHGKRPDGDRADHHGDPLPPGALARMGTIRLRPGTAVSRLVFSPDGKLVASSGYERPVHVWETASGKELFRLPDARGSGSEFVGFFDKGKVIATRGEEGLRLWDSATGKERGTVPALWRQYNVLSADGKTLATADFKGKWVHLLDPATGKEKRLFIQHPDEAPAAGGIIGVVISPDGKTVAVAGLDGVLRLLDTASGAVLRKIDAPITFQDADSVPLAFSPDGQTLAGCLANKLIRLWHVPTGKERNQLKGHDDQVWVLTFSPDGKTLASGGRDETVRLWDPASGQEIRRISGHHSWVMSLAFAPDGRTLAVGTHRSGIRLWDPATGREAVQLGGNECRLLSATLSPDVKILATGSKDGSIRFWNAATAEELRKIETGHGWVRSVVFSPDGKTLASAGSDGSIRIWDLTTGKELHRMEGHEGAMGQVAFSPDGKLLACTAADGGARLWDPATGKEVARFGGNKVAATCLAFSPAAPDWPSRIRTRQCAFGTSPRGKNSSNSTEVRTSRTRSPSPRTGGTWHWLALSVCVLAQISSGTRSSSGTR